MPHRNIGNINRIVQEPDGWPELTFFSGSEDIYSDSFPIVISPLYSITINLDKGINQSFINIFSQDISLSRKAQLNNLEQNLIYFNFGEIDILTNKFNLLAGQDNLIDNFDNSIYLELDFNYHRELSDFPIVDFDLNEIEEIII